MKKYVMYEILADAEAEFDREWLVGMTWDNQKDCYVEVAPGSNKGMLIPETEGGYSGVDRLDNGLITWSGDDYIETKREAQKNALKEARIDPAKAGL